jgi:hypothetical protein
MYFKFFKEPLVHFVLIGALIFLYYSWKKQGINSNDSYDITLDEGDINRLNETYQQSWNEKPDSNILKTLIEEEIKSEIFYREAQRLNLDHNDEIIRRRLYQKFEFLVKDMIDAVAPTEEDLQEFYNFNKSKLYIKPKSISFYHINYSDKANQKSFERAFVELNIILKKNLNFDEKNLRGDNSHLPKFQMNKSFSDLTATFGNEFASTVIDWGKLGWINKPIPSEFGHHLVYVSDILAQSTFDFESVKDNVIQDWKEQERMKYNESIFTNLKSRYRIKVAEINVQ